MSQKLRIGIVGCGGKMGRMLIEEILSSSGLTLAGGVDGAPAIVGQDLGVLAGRPPIGIAASADSAALVANSDVLIDFTIPAATVELAGLTSRQGKALIIGTTGLDQKQAEAIHRAAETIPIVWAPNFSLGLNILLGLVKQSAAMLGAEYDIEILEMHHRQKIDAPSGTALGLGKAAAEGRGVELDRIWVKTRDGYTGARETGSIGFATLRGGDVVGDHTVMFAAKGERLELSHKAGDRAIFARGAVRAAAWVHGKPPGLYGMNDVLGLR